MEDEWMVKKSMVIKNIIKIEGVIVFLSCLIVYLLLDYNWILFVALLLFPDIAMIGYVVSNKIGAITYNLLHTYSLPIPILLLGFSLSLDLLLAIALIWMAHIGMDRAIGYGLKYSSSF
jgi:hypothetical protein